MKKLPLSMVAAVACAFLLNACSSGGGSAPSASSTPQNNPNQTSQQEADKKAAEQAKAEADKKAAEQAKAEAEKKAAEQAKAEAEKKAAEQVKAEAEKKAAEQAKAEAERKKAEEDAKKQAENNVKPQPEQDSGSAFSEALAKGFAANHSEKPGYMAGKPVNGLVLSIDNTSGAVTGALPPTEAFNELSIKGTKILLLARAQDKLAEIGLRPLREHDFPEGGYKAEGKGWVGSTGDDRQGNFANVRYGVYTVDGKSHLFVQGNPSTWLYRTAKYVYSGNAVHGKDGVYHRAKTEAVVDFGNKTVDVTITPPGVEGGIAPSPLKFGGTINGNTFSGTKNDIETRGGFFGPGGQDLGGVYHAKGGEHKGYNGAYGASDRQIIR